MFQSFKQPLTPSQIGDLIIQYAKICRDNDFGIPVPEHKAYEVRRFSVNRRLQSAHPELSDLEISAVLDLMLKSKQVIHLNEEHVVFPVSVL